jgi:hypothetical protein
MIAVDPPVRILFFLLHPRGRPHMHQGDAARVPSDEGIDRYLRPIVVDPAVNEISDVETSSSPEL